MATEHWAFGEALPQLVKDVDWNENWSEKKEEASIVGEVEQDFSSLLIDPGLHVE